MDNKLKELLYTAAYCSDSNELRIAAEECGKQAESCSDKTTAEMWKYLKITRVIKPTKFILHYTIVNYKIFIRFFDCFFAFICPRRR